MSVLFALVVQALGSHWLQQESPLFNKKKGSFSNFHIHSKHHMKQAYDGSMASLLLVPCIGPSFLFSPQLLEELVNSFDCDRLSFSNTLF